MTTCYVGGSFDIFHRGHVELLRAAAAMAERVVVAVNSDAFTESRPRHADVMLCQGPAAVGTFIAAQKIVSALNLPLGWILTSVFAPLCTLSRSSRQYGQRMSVSPSLLHAASAGQPPFSGPMTPVVSLVISIIMPLSP